MSTLLWVIDSHCYINDTAATPATMDRVLQMRKAVTILSSVLLHDQNSAGHYQTVLMFRLMEVSQATIT